MDALADEEVASIIAGMKDVIERGLPAAKHLRGDVYEVRADASTRSFRLLFATEGTYSQVLLSLSVFEKRTQEDPAARARAGGGPAPRLAASWDGEKERCGEAETPLRPSPCA